MFENLDGRGNETAHQKTRSAVSGKEYIGEEQAHKQVKHLIQTKIRSAYDSDLRDILGLAAQSAEESPSGFMLEMLYYRIKHSRQDSQGIPTLLDKNQNILVRKTKQNQQSLINNFKLFFFSQRSPLRLGQLCIDKVLYIFDNVPETLECIYPIMSDITISTKGIIKLLGYLETDMA